MLFGPAYKGITLAAAVAIELARLGPQRAVLPTTARKPRTTAKAARWSARRCAGRVVIVDDVITDGASKRESVELIRARRAQPVAVLIALDRMERGGSDDNLSRAFGR